MRNRVALFVAMGLFVAAAVGLAVVADSGDDDGLPRLAFAGAGGERDSAATAGADMALYPAYDVDYRLGKAIAQPADEAPAYKLTGPDKAAVTRLAAALDLAAPATEDETWVAKGTAGELRVERGSGMWWFGPGADTAVSSPAIKGCAPCPPDTICTMECRQPDKPEGMPTEAEAEQAARDFWAKAGIEPGEVRVEDHFMSWYVHFTPELDGRRLEGIQASVGVGPHKAILSANGWMGGTDKLGDYPLISIDDAVNRLNNPPVYAYDGGREPAIVEDQPMPADSGPVTTHPPDSTGREIGGGTSGSTGSAGSSDPGSSEPGKPTEPAPDGTFPHRGTVVPNTIPPDAGSVPEPMPMPPVPTEPQVVTLVGVRLALQFTGTHLVPVYVFTTDAQGDVQPVPAVPDEHLFIQPRPEMLTK